MIVTTCHCPPIPVRTHDWSAHRDGHEESGPIGWGRTRAEAIADLLEQETDACPATSLILN